MKECDHKFIDSKHCLKCGWVPPRLPTKEQHAFASQAKAVTNDGEVFAFAKDVAERDARGLAEALKPFEELAEKYDRSKPSTLADRAGDALRELIAKAKSGR